VTDRESTWSGFIENDIIGARGINETGGRVDTTREGVLILYLKQQACGIPYTGAEWEGGWRSRGPIDQSDEYSRIPNVSPAIAKEIESSCARRSARVTGTRVTGIACDLIRSRGGCARVSAIET
jgi:hypothetical protein